VNGAVRVRLAGEVKTCIKRWESLRGRADSLPEEKSGDD